MRKRPCLLFACIFLTGIVFGRHGWKCLWVVPLGFLLLEMYYVHNNRKRMAGRSILLLSAFFLGICHMNHEEAFRNAYMSKIEDGKPAIIIGEILKIEETDYGSRLVLTDCYVSLKEANIPCNKVMVYASSDQYRVGQFYQIKGQFHLFESARNEGNFDSALFYQSQKIDFLVYESESVLLGYDKNMFRDGILMLKKSMEQVYRESMKEEAAGFFIGMLLGDKSLLSERTKHLFAVAGISHILAISGLHMSMIGRGVYGLLRKRRIGFLTAGVLAALVVLSYCYMVGNGTSAVRAVGMMLLFFLAQYLGRSYDMLNALGAVVLYLLWDNPFLIEYSGFQFSLAALIGVGFVGQNLSNAVAKKDEKTRDVKENTKWYFNLKLWKSIKIKSASSLWMSIGITLCTLPIMACCYFEVPMYSPIVNSILLPLLTPIFGLALIGALIGCVIPFVGRLLLIPCEWLFIFYEFVCEIVEGLPFGSVITGIPEMEIIVLYYVVLFVGCIILKRQISFIENDVSDCKKSRTILRTKLLLSTICFCFILIPKSSQSEIVFLDVGQGDGIFIACEDGTTCFIDGGSSDVKQVGIYRILPFLKAHGVKKIDYWFVSHADADHMSGLLEVMEAGYEVGAFVISDKMPEDEKKQQLLLAAERKGISIIHMKKGDVIRSSSKHRKGMSFEQGISIMCLYPWDKAIDRNEQSMVLLVDFFDKNESVCRAIFSGDISSKGEALLLKEYGNLSLLENIEIYKSAHHGSKYSNSQELLELIQPKHCVISCGMDNSYGHPHKEVLERMDVIGTELFYTMDSGQITVHIDENIQIQSWLQESESFGKITP